MEPNSASTAKLTFDEGFSSWALSSYAEVDLCKREIALADVVHKKADRTLKFNTEDPVTIYATYLGGGYKNGLLESISCKTVTSFKPKPNVNYFIEATHTSAYCKINIYEKGSAGTSILEKTQVVRKMLTKETEATGHCEKLSDTERTRLGI